MTLGLGWPEVAVILVLGLFVFGPERLPHLASEAGRMLRGLRTQVKGITDDLKTELGPELGDLDLASLHPKAFVRKHLWEDDDDALVEQLSGRPRGTVPLLAGEAPPWDRDAT